MADKKITELDALTTLASGDVFAVVDDPSGTPVTKKITIDNLLKAVNILTAETAPTAADELALYDASAGTADKVTVSALLGTGWILDSNTWTYASATTFTVSGDVTATLHKGTKLKLTQTTVKYFYATSVSYSAPNTTVTATAGTTYTLADAAITSPHYSYVGNPQGFPTFFSFTPTFEGFSADPGSAVIKFRIEGLTLTWGFAATDGTSNAATFTMTLPVASRSMAFFPMRAKDGSSWLTTPCLSFVNAGSYTLTLYTAWVTGTWTASGTKNAQVSGTYLI